MAGMRITKLGHACVRLEHEGTTLVLDPGVFTDAGALDGADAVLITHEHPDHYLPDHLRASDAAVFTIGAVAARIREDARTSPSGSRSSRRGSPSTPAGCRCAPWASGTR